MKKFLQKIALILCVVFAIYVLETLISFFVVGDRYEATYNAAIVDKMERLASIKGPKIVLVGDSNVAYGIDSPLLEESLGMPVVNLGLHAGLGNVFHERMVLNHISPGDYIIILHSSYNDDCRIFDIDLAWLTLEHHVSFYSFVPPAEWPRMLQAFPSYAGETFRMWLKRRHKRSSPPYARECFNAWGDSVYDRPECRYTLTEKDRSFCANISEACSERLNELSDRARSCGAHVLIAAFPLHGEKFAHRKALVKRLEDNLKRKLKADVISDFEQYIFPPESFFDTYLHLTNEGAKQRTMLLISDIRRWREQHAED